VLHRLAAIIHADLAGFTRIVEGAETPSLRYVKAAQTEVWRPAIDAANGRLVDAAGNAMLAEFASAVTAVTTAIDIQERMARLNEALVGEQKLLFRIGVHLGEVVVDEDTHDFFGDGVNLAERIRSMAEPGGIAVSRVVRDLVELRINYSFVDGGEHQLKDVSHPVQIFHVRAAKPSVRVSPTARMVPQITLRFEGADSASQKHSFDVALDKLVGRSQGMLIGRADECDLVVAHASVSRRHARLSLLGDALQIEDLGSTNGTVVAGQMLRTGESVALHAGNNLKLGAVALLVRHLAHGAGDTSSAAQQESTRGTADGPTGETGEIHPSSAQ
jgi:class 3 adenylate cyclase